MLDKRRNPAVPRAPGTRAGWETMSDFQRRQTLHILLAGSGLCLAILSFVSPQVSVLGHGLMTALPALAVSWFGIQHIEPRAFGNAFFRFRVAFVMGFLFLLQVVVRFTFFEDATDLMHTFFVGPIMILALLLWTGAYVELGRHRLIQLRYWVLFTWGVSVAVSIPTLFRNYGIARETMGNKYYVENMAMWAPYGVGEYSLYTALAICFAPLIYVAVNFKGVRRWISVSLVCCIAVAVALSTYTMATSLLLFSLAGSIGILIAASRGIIRVAVVTVVLFGIALLPFLYMQASDFPQLAFVTQKVERLVEGFSTYGLEQGDETGRGWMFVDEMKAVSREPFFGYIPHVTGQGGHGHSSLANSLSLFGLFGASFWVIALGSIMANCMRYAGNSTEKYVVFLAWGALFLGGILNPIWHAPTALGGLFLLTVPIKVVQPSANFRRREPLLTGRSFNIFRFISGRRHR
jgi:hypothetical protein